MLQRNLLYTAVTRGKRLVVLVGQKKALSIAVRGQQTRRCQATSGEQAAGDIADPSTPLPTIPPNSLCCFALSASNGMRVDGSEMSFPACWQMSPDSRRWSKLKEWLQHRL